MAKLKNEVGNKYGRLTVVTDAGRNSGGTVLWRCVCCCGNSVTVLGTSLRTGNTKSCGCLAKDNGSTMGKSLCTHGLSKNKLYYVWKQMVSRCTKHTNPVYNNYGGRGIKVCEEWVDSPEAFVLWALDNDYKEGLQLDRRDNNKGYEPENCRFVTRYMNIHNKRRLMSTNTSGYAGVSLTPKGGFRARLNSIRLNPKKKYIGTFPTAWEACQARNKFIKKHTLPHKIQEKLN